MSEKDKLAAAAAVDNIKDDVSDDSETKKRKRHPENYNDRNKLKMGQFHRYAIDKPKKRVSSNKKKIRDLKRLMEKKGEAMPEEIKVAKALELKELKKTEKCKKEAEKFESRYKKIKFFEKKKVIRKLENITKLRSGVAPDDTEGLRKLDVEKQVYRNYLTYVCNYPSNAKYISLFPTSETDKSVEQRDQMMDKILKIAEVKTKLRDKELREMDKELEEEDDQEENEAKVAKKVKKLVMMKDAFFTLDENEAPVEKKIVSRNGLVAGEPTIPIEKRFNRPRPGGFQKGGVAGKPSTGYQQGQNR